MKSFKEFLQEMPVKISSVDPTPSLERHPRYINDEKKSPLFNTTRIGKLPSGHHLYKQVSNLSHTSVSYVAVNPTQGRVVAELNGQHSNPKIFRVNWAARHLKAKFKMADFTHHLITHHGLELHSSTEHSPGSVNHWKELSEKPGIEMERHFNDKKVKLYTGNDFSKNYNRKQGTSKFIARASK